MSRHGYTLKEVVLILFAIGIVLALALPFFAPRNKAQKNASASLVSDFRP